MRERKIMKNDNEGEIELGRKRKLYKREREVDEK